jgi:hypothetical protein
MSTPESTRFALHDSTDNKTGKYCKQLVFSPHKVLNFEQDDRLLTGAYEPAGK